MGDKIPHRTILAMAARIAIVYVILSITGTAASEHYGRMMIPFYRWEISVIAPKYEIVNFILLNSGVDSVFAVGAVDQHYYYDNGALVSPGSYAYEAHMTVLKGMQHVVLILLVPLSWPKFSKRRRFLALAYSAAVLIIVEVVDVPIDLLGTLDGQMARTLDLRATWAMEWSDIMASGGRDGIALLGGVLACFLATLTKSRTTDSTTTQSSLAKITPVEEKPLSAETVRSAELSIESLPKKSNIHQEWHPIITYNLQIKFEDRLRSE